MITIKKQYYGIKFPFTANNVDGFFLDLNKKYEDKIASEIAHVLLTPKKSRIRKPDFGTNLIKFIFESNNDTTWGEIEREAKDSISKYVPNAELTDIKIIHSNDEPNSLFLDLQYTTAKGIQKENNRMVIKL